MAKKQTFGDKLKAGKDAGTMIKVVYSRKSTKSDSYAFGEKFVKVPEGSDPVKTALDAIK